MSKNRLNEHPLLGANAAPLIRNFRHDKLKKMKSASELVLAMVNPPNVGNSQPAGSALPRFSRKVRDG